MTTRRRPRGFTLVEAMVGLVIALLVLHIVTSALLVARRNLRMGDLAHAIQHAAFLARLLDDDLRSAVRDPETDRLFAVADDPEGTRTWVSFYVARPVPRQREIDLLPVRWTVHEPADGAGAALERIAWNPEEKRWDRRTFRLAVTPGNPGVLARADAGLRFLPEGDHPLETVLLAVTARPEGGPSGETPRGLDQVVVPVSVAIRDLPSVARGLFHRVKTLADLPEA